MDNIRKSLNIEKVWDEFNTEKSEKRLEEMISKIQNEMQEKIYQGFKEIGYESKVVTIVFPFDYAKIPYCKAELVSEYVNKINFRVHIFDKKGSVYTIYTFPENKKIWNEILSISLQRPKNLGNPKIMTFLIDLKNKLLS